ncbi:hypothetical protein MCEKH45_01930 [Methylophilaceae bacterium]
MTNFNHHNFYLFIPPKLLKFKDAIRRKNWKSFNKLISKGAELYAKFDDGKTLAEKIDELKEVKNELLVGKSKSNL